VSLIDLIRIQILMLRTIAPEMSGGISFGDEESWFANTWRFCDVVEGAARHIDSARAPELSKELAQPESLANTVHHIWLEKYPAEERAAFAEAVRSFRIDLEREGPSTWKQPDRLAPWLKHLDELIQMLDRCRLLSA
jgi:hypothetical protein